MLPPSTGPLGGRASDNITSTMTSCSPSDVKSIAFNETSTATRSARCQRGAIQLILVDEVNVASVTIDRKAHLKFPAHVKNPLPCTRRRLPPVTGTRGGSIMVTTARW